MTEPISMQQKIQELQKENEKLREEKEIMKVCQNCIYRDRFANVDPCRECNEEGMYINWDLDKGWKWK